jgi:hypothetical protein
MKIFIFVFIITISILYIFYSQPCGGEVINAWKTYNQYNILIKKNNGETCIFRSYDKGLGNIKSGDIIK